MHTTKYFCSKDILHTYSKLNDFISKENWKKYWSSQGNSFQ